MLAIRLGQSAHREYGGLTRGRRRGITKAGNCGRIRFVTMTADTLPDDVKSLRALVLAARAERDRFADQIARLRHIIRELQRARFGRRSEKLDADQLQLVLEEQETAAARDEATQEKRGAAPRRRPGRRERKSLPPHLPRVEVVIEPEDKSCPCCRGAMHVIGEEKAERLDVIPAQYRVIVTRRPKYGCRACEGTIVQAPAPEHLIRAGLPTEALVAHVLVSKYAWHLPLYRQAQMLLSQGIAIDRSVLAFWVGYAGAELMPLWRRLREILLGSARLFVDETRAPVLDPGRGRTKSGYLWSIARDDRPWRGNGPGTGPPAVAYTYAPGRGGKHATALLAGYYGIVHCDGYGVYKQLADPKRTGGPATLAFCWSHWRRRYYEIARGGPAPIADDALRRIAALYAIEEKIRGRSAEERRAVRQTESKPLVEALKSWLDVQLARVSAKSTMAQAIRYGLNHWQGLVRFLEDGRIEMDTNIVERSMRPIGLTRKNALFAGHDGAAENWACVASLVETCKLNGVDPQAYMADVLTKLVDLWPEARLDELMPWAWARPRHGAEPIAA
jgi:transposase